MTLYWMLFCFVVVWASLIALLDFDALGRANVMRFATRGVLVVTLSLFVGLFSETGSVDFENYVALLGEAPPETFWELFTLKDPFFQLLGFLFRSSDGGLAWLMFVLTFMSFGIKIRILSSKHYKDIIGLAVVFLVARFFLLHEFTQIRVSLGIAIMSIAIMYAMERKLILVLVTIAIAIMTHLSTLAMLPVVLLTYRAELKGKIYLFSFMSVIILIMGLAFDAERFSRLAPYMTGEYYVTENTLLSSYFLFKVAVLIVLLFQWKLLTTPMRNALLASAYGIFLTCIFLKNDVLSLRLGELVGVFDCLCFAYFFRHGMRLGSSYGYLGGVIAASGLYFSSIGIVNPLGLRF